MKYLDVEEEVRDLPVTMVLCLRNIVVEQHVQQGQGQHPDQEGLQSQPNGNFYPGPPPPGQSP